MPVTLYPRQRQILDFLHQYIQKYGHAPTLTEICQAIGVSSPATVHEHLSALHKKGIIRRMGGQVRGIEIIATDLAQSISSPGSVEVPLLGYIVAGKPLEPHEETDATVNVPHNILTGRRRGFVLQVKGDSMKDDGILHDDFVVIEEQKEAKNGQIVVALLEGGLATLKRFHRSNGQVKLIPANSEMEPIVVPANQVQIQGRVVGVIRKYL